ncbi:MAG: 4Fe-4S binding protein, partial [Desulfatiglandales bacterium]
PSFSHDRCKVCMSCAKICPMNAISKALGKEEVDRGDLMVCFEDKCIGCGLCSHHCPEDAITMKRARNNISEQTAKDCWSKFSKERIY